MKVPAAALLLVGAPHLASATPGWNFLVMGDWGGASTYPYTTVPELITAQGLATIGAQENSSYCLALGDNFYHNGVKSTTDQRWNSTFENVFTGDVLQGDDYFRVLLGNHDHLGSPTAQIQYSNISSRWRMDDLYWSFSETAKTGATLDTIFIDTVTWAGLAHTVDEQGDIHSLHGNQLPGPSDKQAADAQFEWLEDQLKDSTADYIIVAGHYPVYSVCEHGTTLALANLIPLLEKYNVAAYLNGHDHCQQYIDDGKGVQYHTIGSAHLNDGSQVHIDTIPEGSLKFHVGDEDGQTGGFGRITIDEDGLTIRHYAGNGTVIFTAPTLKPRTAHNVATPMEFTELQLA